VGNELSGLKAAICVPTTGHIDPICEKDLRIGMMVAANHGLMWTSDCSPDRMGYGPGRNAASQSIFKEPDLADGIMWVDSDIRQKPSDIFNLLLASKQYGAEFSTGIYHQRGGDNRPVFYEWKEKERAFSSAYEYPENVFAPVGGCGFGFTWTSGNVLRKMSEVKEFDPKTGWFADKRDSGGFGEDLHFCYLAIRAGIQLHAHTGIQLGHCGDPIVITRETYQERRSQVNVVVKEEPVLWGR
jgi:hypothetical protein